MLPMIDPKKSLGQNFLQDIHIIQKIKDALDIQPTDQLLEIGPGLGALTKVLLPESSHYVAIEIDSRCIEQLLPLQDQYPYFQPILGDFLSIDLTPWKKFTKVVGNLPYHIATPIMEKIATSLEPTKIVCMFASETADRFIANTASLHYSSASILMQSFFTMKEVCTVKKGSFFPPPKITSKVLSFEPKIVPVAPTLLFTKFVQKIFSYRRKTLYNAIKNSFSLQVAEYLQSHVDISMQKRPEVISREEYQQLFLWYRELQK
jgi:16S rRNA (adenine1518-N6/adenine1519-N6)-dimethyltransferase